MAKQETAKTIVNQEILSISIAKSIGSSNVVVSPQIEQKNTKLQFSNNSPNNISTSENIAQQNIIGTSLIRNKKGEINESENADVDDGTKSELLLDLSNACGSADGSGKLVRDDSKSDYFNKTHKGVFLSERVTKKIKDNKIDSRTCEDDGLIVATHDGYVLIKVFENWYSNRTIRWLGNNPKHPCIIRNIGFVRRYLLTTGTPRGVTSRWAFEPRKRLFWLDVSYKDNNNIPSAPTLGLGLPDIMWGLGFSWPAYGGGSDIRWTYNHPSFGGTLSIPDVVRFGLSEALIFLYDRDYYWAITEWEGSSTVSYTKGFSVANIVLDEDCENISLTDNSIKRLLEQTNIIRTCEYGESVLNWDSELAIVAKDYATKMATEDFFGHVDPTGKTVVDRVNQANIKYQSVGEILNFNEIVYINTDLTNELLDNAFTSWCNSESHFALMIDANFTNVGFGCDYHIIGEEIRWYFVGVFTLPGEQSTSEYSFDRCILNMDDSITHLGSDKQTIYQNMPCLRAFSSAPRTKFRPHCITYRAISWDRWGLGRITNSTHTEEYGFNATQFLTGGGHYHNIQSTLYVPAVINYVSGRKYIEYDPDGRSIYLDIDYNSCSLVVDGITIEFSMQDNSTSGEVMFSGIFVGSIFHSSPEYNYNEPASFSKGETVITYGISRVTKYEENSWDNPSIDNYMKEYYYELEMTYWCVLINVNGDVVSKFQLGGIPDIDVTEIEYNYDYHEQAANGIQENFIFQMDGPIKPFSVEVKYMVEGQNYRVIDDGEGMIIDTSSHLATSVIDYNSGSISLTFGSPQPDNNSNVVITALVGIIEDRFEMFVQTGNLAYYEDKEFYQPATFEIKGSFPYCPSYTITQDGNYIVGTFGMYSGDNIIDTSDRLTPHNTIHDVPSTSRIFAQCGKIQYIVYDRTGKIVAGPFFVPNNISYSNSVVLN